MAELEFSDIKTFYHLIGEPINGTFVTEDMLKSAINKVIGDKRRTVKLHILATESDSHVIQTFIDEDDVMRGLVSVTNLKARNPDTSVKFDDVRNMDLSLENWDTYTPAERKVARGLLCAYNDFYDLTAPNDKAGIYDVIDLEVRMQAMRLFIRLSKKKEETLEYDVKLSQLRVQWSKALDDLALKKKQRDVAKPKPGAEAPGDLTDAIKSLDEMEAEKAKRQKEIQKKKLAKK